MFPSSALSSVNQVDRRSSGREETIMRIRDSIRPAGAAVATAVLVSALVGSASANSFDPQAVHRFADGSAIPNTRSSLSSDAGGVRYTFDTRELVPGHAYTLWLVVFNRPENCSHGAGDGVRCGPGDLPPYGGDDSAQTSFLLGDGQVAAAGPAMFRGTRATGSTEGALWGPGIVNPTSAEIHLLLRDHGVSTRASAFAMTHSFDACNPDCVFVQFSPHVQGDDLQ
jgi:hypothetical protein